MAAMGRRLENRRRLAMSLTLWEPTHQRRKGGPIRNRLDTTDLDEESLERGGLGATECSQTLGPRRSPGLAAPPGGVRHKGEASYQARHTDPRAAHRPQTPI